ncbi:MAG: ThiF family adenylyltransferase [Candidatus Thermoplasmatota archaeon]|jgi:molybdopterin/thiamine biosynthesis adenylyltransferase|nr:ThiF family adenylyltransferase [Candidatus Thermoplasmatota archaeon]MCL5962800.1 ThiF family adenylyltransferase [Candidatus Thermoplasmatota archaeon]
MEKGSKIKIITKNKKEKKDSVSQGKAKKSIKKLKIGYEDSDIHDRIKRIPWIKIDKIKKSRVLVIGAGAIGNEVMKNLALSGFNDITLIDMDHVVISNLNRCLFFTFEDAKSKIYKVDAIKNHIKDMVSSINIKGITKPVEEIEEEFFNNFDIIFGCVDNILARVRINSLASHYQIPYVDGGTHGMVGKVQVILPPDTPCIECNLNISHYKNLEQLFTCSGRDDTKAFEPKIPAEVTTTAIIAGVMVREGLKILSDKRDNVIKHIFYYDGLTNKSDILESEISKGCSNHSKNH